MTYLSIYCLPPADDLPVYISQSMDCKLWTWTFLDDQDCLDTSMDVVAKPVVYPPAGLQKFIRMIASALPRSLTHCSKPSSICRYSKKVRRETQ